MSLIGPTAFSREGRGIHQLKLLPLAPKSLAIAKLAHASLFNLLGCLIAGVSAWLFI